MSNIDPSQIQQKLKNLAEEKRKISALDPEIQSIENRIKNVELSEKEEWGEIIIYLKTFSRLDIENFYIPEGQTWGEKVRSKIKKILWRILKFYFQRLLAQQNTINEKILKGLQLLDHRLKQIEQNQKKP